MKVVLINGSPHERGATYTALKEMSNAIEDEGIETEIIHIGTEAMYGCRGCGQCEIVRRCVLDDGTYHRVLEEMKSADGIAIGSPVYFGGINGALASLLDRLFYSAGELFVQKPAAAVVSCRRGGASTAFDSINKYFAYNQMPIVTSQNWNTVHGNTPDEVQKDKEGLQTMRTLGKNMACAVSIIGHTDIELPKIEDQIETNFIR